MNANKALRIKGFTLIELLTVITIIVILAGMTVGALGWVQRKAAVDKALAQKALLENGLEQFYADNGFYPITDDGADKTGLTMYYALFGDGVGPDGNRKTAADNGSTDGVPDEGATVYLAELDPNSNSMGLLEGQPGRVPTRVVDPFGNAWEYTGGQVNKGTMNNPDFDLYSRGPDGKVDSAESGDDDFKNW